MNKLFVIIFAVIFCLGLTFIIGTSAEELDAVVAETKSPENTKSHNVPDTSARDADDTLGNAPPLSGVRTVGPGGDYTSIGLAITDIQTQGLDGALIVELLPAYVSTVETFPLNFTNLTGISALKTVTLRPQAGATNRAITGNNATTIINLENVRFLTIDGRPGGVGITKELTVENTNTTGAAVRLINEASNNTIRHTTIKGATTGQTSGVVFFSTTTGANGNDNNTITNCDIGNSISLPRNAVFSSGTNSTLEQFNNSNIISNNNIFNFHIAAGDASGAAIFFGNADWTISGNSFFQTAARTGGVGTTRGIWIFSGAAGGNFTISNNFFGGSQANAGGAAWTNSGTTANSRFDAIELNISSQTPSNVQGNVIRNFSWETSSTAAALPGIFCGIFVQQGAVNIGTTAGNTIGSGTGTGSINVTTSGDGGTTFGIGTAGFPDRNIFNNTIGSITTNGTSTSVAASLIAIQVTNGINTITGNLIGSLSTANSLNAANSSTSATGQRVIGIHSTNFGGATISNNTIVNGNNNAVGTAAAEQSIGILTTQGTNQIVGNNISWLTTTSGNVGEGSNASVIGIAQTSTSSGQNIEQNTIFALVNNNLTAVRAIGIRFAGGSTGTNAIGRNLIYDIAVGGDTGFAIGMQVKGNATVSNNMVRLGFAPVPALNQSENTSSHDRIEGTSALAYAFRAFVKEPDDSPLIIQEFTHNSFAIAGDAAPTSDAESVTLEIHANNEVTSKNNIIVNDRSSQMPGAKNYAIRVTGTGLNSDSNIYDGNGNGFVFGSVNGTDVPTLDDWIANFAMDNSSAFTNPRFISVADLHLQQTNPAVGAGEIIPEVTTDFDGDLRLIPIIGADHDSNFISSGDFFAPRMPLEVISNDIVSSGRTLNGVANITDNVAVATGANRPRFYYRKSTDANGFVGNTSSDNGWKFVEATNDSNPYSFVIDYTILFGGSVMVGDTISYFVAAQDEANNLGSNPGGAGSSGNPKIQNINMAPQLQYIYQIVGTLPPVLTVCATGCATDSLTNPGGVFEMINNGGIASDTRVEIQSDLNAETGVVKLTSVAQSNFPPDLTLTIASDGNNHSISGTSGIDGLFVIHDVQNLIIDGSGNGTENLLSFENNADEATFELDGDLHNITLQGLIIKGRNTNPNSAVFDAFLDLKNLESVLPTIHVRDTLICELNSANIPANLLNVRSASGVPVPGFIIEDSFLVNFSKNGIFLNNVTSTRVKNNVICASGTATANLIQNNFDVDCSGPARTTNLIGADVNGDGIIDGNDFRLESDGGFAIGARVGNSDETGTTEFTRNRTLVTGSADTLIGTQFLGGGIINSSNNQTTANGSKRVVAIEIEGFFGGALNFNNNSSVVHCPPTTPANLTGDSPTTVFDISSSNAANITGNNNISLNDCDDVKDPNLAAAIRGSSGTSLVTLNYNAYGGRNLSELFVVAGGIPTNFSNWLSGTGSDANSLVGDTAGEFSTSIFVDSFGANNDIAPFQTAPLSGGTGYEVPPFVSNAGTPIPGITTDFGGIDTRHPTHPDIGADEGSFDRTLTTSGTLPPGNYDNITVGTGFSAVFDGPGITTTLGGIINVSGLMSVSCSSTLAGASPSNYIVGNLNKDFCAPAMFEYPVGTTANGNEYSPVAANVTNLPTNPSSLTVKANYGTAPSNPPLFDASSLDRFWSLTETGSLTADLLFNYLQTDVDGDENMYQTVRVENAGIAQFLPNGTPCPGGGSPCVDVNGNTIFVSGVSDFSDWAAAIPFAPTAANVSISGRVFDFEGRPISRAMILLTDMRGNVRTAITNPFGYYRFADLAAGDSYIIDVRHKSHLFAAQVITVNEDITNFDVIALP